MTIQELLNESNRNQKVSVDANALITYFLKAKDIAEKSTQIGADQAVRLNHLMSDVIDSIPSKFRVLPTSPEYQVGKGPDNEFVVVAKTYSKNVAEQIAEFLNKG